jgi:hypothetical protein
MVHTAGAWLLLQYVVRATRREDSRVRMRITGV